jgi:hypothetical protein
MQRRHSFVRARLPLSQWWQHAHGHNFSVRYMRSAALSIASLTARSQRSRRRTRQEKRTQQIARRQQGGSNGRGGESRRYFRNKKSWPQLELRPAKRATASWG